MGRSKSSFSHGGFCVQYYRAYQLINKTYEFASAVCFTSGIAIKIG